MERAVVMLQEGEMVAIRIADHARSPGGRYVKDGPYSGEWFRDQILAEPLRMAVKTGDVLEVELDKTSGYGSSFLEEAFGGLIRKRIVTSEEARKYLRIVAKSSLYLPYKVLAERYLKNARQIWLSHKHETMISDWPSCVLPTFCPGLPPLMVAKGSDLPSWALPAVSLLSALVVAIANYAIQRWRYRIDRLSAAVDHFCGEINSAADISTRYWLLDTTQNDDSKKSRELEPELVGRQMRLQSLVLALRSLDSAFNITSTEEMLISLFEAMTGGEFQVVGRRPNPEKAQTAQSVAAQLNGELRQSVGSRSHRYF
ncbi:MAG: STAS-like domain-containing protein [Candidatus Binataceae bacterium]